MQSLSPGHFRDEGWGKQHRYEKDRGWAILREVPQWGSRLEACGVREVSLGTARDDDRSTARCAVMTPGDRFRSVIKAGGGVFK